MNLKYSALTLIALSGLCMLASALSNSARALDPAAVGGSSGSTVKIEPVEKSGSSNANINDAINKALTQGKTLGTDDIGKTLGDALGLPADAKAVLDNMLGANNKITSGDLGKAIGTVLGDKTISTDAAKQLESVLGGNAGSVVGKTLSGIFGGGGGGGITSPIFGSSSTGGNSGSGTIAEQTCDTQVWKTMERRARLETEREMMQNQNLIFKADSILNYTCFDSFAAHAAKSVGSLFTHTTYFTGNEIIPWSGKYGMDYALDRAVVSSMISYIEAKPAKDDPNDGNFDHSYLGGRGEFMGLHRPVINRVPQGGADYSCGVMKEIWKVAKCVNFIHTQDFAETDGYYPFIDLKKTAGGEDVAGYQSLKEARQFPKGWDCSGRNVQDPENKYWLTLYRHSRNEVSFGDMSHFYAYSKPLQDTYAAVRKLVEPGQCGDAIPTGVQVYITGDSKPYADGICTNPGCSYRKGGKCVAN